MKAEIISIGDEILIGQIVNTNSSFIAKKLTELGIDVKWITSVGDNREDVLTALENASLRAEVVIATGGLGPTHDDITKKVVTEFFSTKLVANNTILERIKTRFESRGLKMASVNEEQALVPEGAQIIDNNVGIAPGFIFHSDEKYFFILPGVPAEMAAMMKESVLPFLRGKSCGPVIRQKTLRTTGIPESVLFERMGNLAEVEKFAKVAFLPSSVGVDVRLTARDKDQDSCLQRLRRAEERFQAEVGDYIYGYDEETLEEVVARLLFAKKVTVAVAESCTGGLLAHKLTNISGSSKYFERGVIAYSNRAKVGLLRVPPEVIRDHGAVSAETAVAMAQGVREISGTDIGISTTGIAGPTGGSKQKPVGLVYVGYAEAEKSFAKKYMFKSDRLMNKERASQAALDILRRVLVDIKLS